MNVTPTQFLPRVCCVRLPTVENPGSWASPHASQSFMCRFNKSEHGPAVFRHSEKWKIRHAINSTHVSSPRRVRCFLDSLCVRFVLKLSRWRQASWDTQCFHFPSVQKHWCKVPHLTCKLCASHVKMKIKALTFEWRLSSTPLLWWNWCRRGLTGESFMSACIWSLCDMFKLSVCWDLKMGLS
jgi:hypothetical protein